jgi:CPA2 family monovalent cation:H+ antiporter-2
MILKESELAQRAAEESLPFRDAFAVLFFVSVGMLFNPLVLVNEAIPLLVTLTLVLVVSGGTVFVMVRALGRPLADALVIARAPRREFASSSRASARNVRRSKHAISSSALRSSRSANPPMFTFTDRLKARYAPAPLPAAARGG